MSIIWFWIMVNTVLFLRDIDVIHVWGYLLFFVPLGKLDTNR